MDDFEKQLPQPGEDSSAVAREAHVEKPDIVDTKEAIQATDHDDAAGLFAGTEDSFEYTEKEATWVRWKLDLILLTMVCHSRHSRLLILIYCFCSLHLPIYSHLLTKWHCLRLPYSGYGLMM